MHVFESSHNTIWRSGNVVIAPFDKNYIFALLMDDVAYGVTFISLMLNHNLKWIKKIK